MQILSMSRLRMRRLWKEKIAQDLIEYALMAGFVAVTAGALMPGVSTNISKIWSKVANQLQDSANTPNG